MKAMHLAGLLVAPALLLAGCASQDKTARAQPREVVDGAYVAQVEYTARNRGVAVRWVNPPQKRVAGNKL